MEKPATNPSAEEQETAKKAEEKKLKAEKVYREHIDKKISECKYREVDERAYAFEFQEYFLSFRIPTLAEKVKIKSILASVVYTEDIGVVSASMEIGLKGDTDLLASTKLLTHLSEAVVLEKIHRMSEKETAINPKQYVENLSDDEQFGLGYNILIFEREFLDRKKKV